jgi:hypothetical protein
MPSRRKSSEPRTPPATPQRSRSKRNGSGSSQGSLSSQNSQISLGSQKYTAYLRERPTSTNGMYTPPPSQEENPFSREEEIYGRLQLESSQPSILNPYDNNYYNDNNDNVNDVIDDDDGTNQFNSNLPTDRGIVVDNNNRGLLNNFFNFFIDLFVKLLNLIWFTISLIYSIIKYPFNFLTGNGNDPNNNNHNNHNNNNNNNNNNSNNNKNRWLLYLLLCVIILLLLWPSLNVKFGQDNNSFVDFFSSSRIYVWAIDSKTYKIQPIGEKKKDVNDSLVVTLDDFRRIIIAEVKSYMDSQSGKHSSSMSNEPLRAMISDEIKNIISSEIKKSSIRKKGSSRDEETSLRKIGSSRDEKALNVIRNEARKVVKEELLKYSQDKLNRRDFALHSGGAKIISKYTSKTYEIWPNEWYKKTFALITGKGITRGKPPVTAISHDTNVGQCWPLSGQEGQLAIFLDRRVYVTAVTYDHISKDIATDDVLSAPKDFEVWGIIDNGSIDKESNNNDDDDYDPGMDLSEDFNPRMESTEDTCGRRNDDQYDDGLSHMDPNLEFETNGELRLGSSPYHLFLGKFTYDTNGSPIQTFEVPEHILKYNRPIRAIIMRIINNWGKPEYTCLYRFRVHGEPAIPTVSAGPKIK